VHIIFSVSMHTAVHMHTPSVLVGFPSFTLLFFVLYFFPVVVSRVSVRVGVLGFVRVSRGEVVN